MVQNVWEKIAEDLHFIKNGNFIRECTEAAVRGCSEPYYNKVAALKPVILLQ